MLLSRSIFLQVCLLLTLTRCYCQDYENNYDIEESDDQTENEEDSGPVDYSKYYSVDTSAPLVSAQGNPSQIGFSSPIEYSGFFEPNIDFGASIKTEVAQPKNPFTPPANPFAESTKTLGFVANQETFPNFASSGNFPIDYFEEAQKAQQKANQEETDDGFVPPHPSFNLDGEYSSDAGKVQFTPPQKQQGEYDVEKQAAKEYEFQPSAPNGKYTNYNTGKSSSTVAQYPQAPGYYEKYSQAAAATPYQKYSFQPVTEEGAPVKYLDGLISTVAPFNPSYSKIATTAAPAIETQPSENIPSHLKNKNCQRIKKHIPGTDEHGRRKREAMNCFVCDDPATSSKFTQCSYAVEPEPKNDYSATSERYSTPSKGPDGFRYKRYSGDENVDPYEFIKSRSQKTYDDDEKKEYEEYKFPEFYTADDGIDRSFSEVQSEAITKNPANCHKEESEGMTCTVCKDPKTGGNFEQCSYTSQPKEQKYAYVTEKKYDSDEPEQGSESNPVVQTKQVESNIKKTDEKKSEPLKEFKPIPAPTNLNFAKNDQSKYAKLEDFGADTKESPVVLGANGDYDKFENFKPAELYKKNYQGHDKFKLSDQYNPDSKEDPNSKREPLEGFRTGHSSGQNIPKKLIQDEPYDIPKHFAESTIKEQKTGLRGLEPSLYGSADSSEVEGDDGDSSSNSAPYKDIDEYHFKLFPEFSHEESQQAEVVANNPSAANSRKDVEEVLAEFTRKDRSACKKAQKNGMTCYLCVDNKGIQHEECMYVSESKPQASHVAYHEVKQIKAPENKEQSPAGTEVKSQQVAPAAPAVMQAAASEEYETRIKYRPKKVSKKHVEKEPEHSESQENPKKVSEFDDEPKTKTPVEFVVGTEEGAFSAETKPVYSKTLGVKLPRYMIEKSDFEREFDEFSGHY